eukprot:CAMPEP_0194782364 /NCGR_PEP_ID=MMETSP0323_2-20130528/78648_1 /TAXON_ID=2866 ORGANISM="Crypthecodinium cohnii, Strain Seligo" /NCGR_SAMPLE_ID=MMETSP0323_2 /ASSEMBLY_ACC=CAM_ASM_000346 /LENGTH=195 /DNA_ID=CAMNT_0039721171 /DNA_START=85 /DNA_END=673 /DNA_ORIENTATION=-
MAVQFYDAEFKEGFKVTSVKDVEADKFITAFAQHLKRQGRFEIPKWADVVKTAKFKELPPNDPDWLYVRTASMVRKIYIRGGVGVETAKFKELPPNDPDWLYVRTASMVRKIYIRGGVGVGAFTKIYGGQHRRGVMTNTFARSSGKVARYILQQLEEMGLVEQDENGGRKITKEGQRELDTVAVQAAEVEEEEEE